MQVLVRIIKFVIQLKVLLHFIVHSPQTGQRIRPHHKADSADRSNIQFSVTKTTTRVMDWANTILLIVLILLTCRMLKPRAVAVALASTFL